MHTCADYGLDQIAFLKIGPNDERLSTIGKLAVGPLAHAALGVVALVEMVGSLFFLAAAKTVDFFIPRQFPLFHEKIFTPLSNYFIESAFSFDQVMRSLFSYFINLHVNGFDGYPKVKRSVSAPSHGDPIKPPSQNDSLLSLAFLSTVFPCAITLIASSIFATAAFPIHSKDKLFLKESVLFYSFIVALIGMNNTYANIIPKLTIQKNKKFVSSVVISSNIAGALLGTKIGFYFFKNFAAPYVIEGASAASSAIGHAANTLF